MSCLRKFVLFVFVVLHSSMSSDFYAFVFMILFGVTVQLTRLDKDHVRRNALKATNTTSGRKTVSTSLAVFISLKPHTRCHGRHIGLLFSNISCAN